MWRFNVAPAFMLFFAHFSKVKKTQKKRKRKKGTDPLESLYIFGVHRFFVTFRSCWNPSGFSDSILEKKKVPTPWNPYTIFGSILKSEKKGLFPILLESFGILWFSFRKEKGTDPLKSLYNFGARGSFFSFRSRWNPSGFCDSILEKKKVPTPWNPYTFPSFISKILFPIPLESFGKSGFAFRKICFRSCWNPSVSSGSLFGK